jgi:hypothetical protein
MLNWMRNPDLVGISTIATGLVELCEWILKNCGLVEPDYSNMVMYELGSFAGESSAIFAKYFGEVHCVDPWEDACGAPSLEEVVASFDERSRIAGNIVKHKMTSALAALSVENDSLDFAYIDSGDHSYAMAVQDFQLWWPKIRHGGFLGGHDWEIVELHAADVFPGVRDSVYYMLGQHPEEYGLKLFPDTSWVVRKP